jgi:hypothetical protein
VSTVQTSTPQQRIAAERARHGCAPPRDDAVPRVRAAAGRAVTILTAAGT